MANDRFPQPSLTQHGALRLPAVDVEAYNTELKDEEGFVGDRANKGAKIGKFELWRHSEEKLSRDRMAEALA